MSQARADSTNKSYESGYRKWQSWSSKFSEVKEFPAEDTYVALFLSSLIQSGTLFPTIKSAFYAIKHFHQLAGENDPCTSEICINILEAAKRICNRPKVRKEPLTSQQLKQIFVTIDGKNAPLPKLRDFTMMLIAFAGFLRFNEISSLRTRDIEFKPTYLRLFISKSKTDVYREGRHSYIARTDTDICPWQTLSNYMAKCQLSSDKDEFIFRPLTYFKSKNQYSLRKADYPISYSTTRDNVLKLIEKIGLNAKDFGLHSLRSGGATAAANMGVKDCLFKRHGRWKSESVKDGYVKDELKELLSVTANLGL